MQQLLHLSLHYLMSAPRTAAIFCAMFPTGPFSKDASSLVAAGTTSTIRHLSLQTHHPWVSCSVACSHLLGWNIASVCAIYPKSGRETALVIGHANMLHVYVMHVWAICMCKVMH